VAASVSADWCMDVHKGGLLGPPSAMLLNLAEGPANKSKVGGTAMLERIPVVGGKAKSGAFGGKPGVEGGLVDGENKVRRRVGGGGMKEGDGGKGRGEKAHKSAMAFLVGFREGEPNIALGEEDVFPPKGENFFGTDEGVEREDEEGEVVKLEEGVGGDEEVVVFKGDPDSGACTLVVTAVRPEPKRCEGSEWWGNVVEAAPHFDGRGGVVCLAK
jgi:hypothetical protein